MLRPWRDHVDIYLAPDRVAVMRARRGLRAAVIAHDALSIARSSGSGTEAALAGLGEILAGSQYQAAPARVILADPWARFAFIPASAVRLDADGRASHARYVLEELYGSELADWSVTLTDTPPGTPFMACAVSSSLRARLDEVLLTAQLQLTSLQPQLVTAFNGWRRLLPVEASWFVRLDEGSMTAVRLLRGAWQQVHTARLSADWSLELQRLQAVGRYAEAGAGDGLFYVDAPMNLRAEGRTVLPQMHWLEPDRKLETSPEFVLLQRVAA